MINQVERITSIKSEVSTSSRTSLSLPKISDLSSPMSSDEGAGAGAGEGEGGEGRALHGTKTVKHQAFCISLLLILRLKDAAVNLGRGVLNKEGVRHALNLLF